MPFTYNGIGTKFYGQRDVKPDGSYIATEWIVFIHIPILPIGSFRVWPTGESSNWIVYNSTEYRAKRVPLCWPHIRKVYLLGASLWAIVITALLIIRSGDPERSPTAPTRSPIELAPSSQ
jgi:hypothetical protein